MQEEPKSGLFQWALDRQKEDDGKGAISVWLTTALNWPDAAFRPRDVVFKLWSAGSSLTPPPIQNRA